MKVLLLTDKMETGGVETHIAQLALGLWRSGVEVALFSSGGLLADKLSNEGIPCYTAPLHSRRPLDLLRSYHRLKSLLKDQSFDILHAHTRLTAFLLRYCKRCGGARLVSVHARFRSDFLLKRACYWGDRTLAVSEDLRAYVCDVYQLPAERVTVIPNGIDCARFCPPEEDSRNGAPRILFASRLDRDCSLGAELLCRIAPSLCQRYPGVQIEIAGGGNDFSTICTLAKHANHWLGRQAVTPIGWVEDMATLLRTQDIFLGVSRAALEAAATGCAVILCGNEGYGGILTPQQLKTAGLSNFCARGCAAPTLDALERDISFLLEHPSERRHIGDQLRQSMETSFSSARMCRETLALYHRTRRKSPSLRLAIGGYFGCENIGDDAMLLGFLEELNTVAPHVAVTALTGHPSRDRRRFGISCINRKNPIAIGATLYRSAAFLCGGGSLLQNLTSRHSLSYYLALIKMAQRQRCQTVLYAAGIGPLIGKGALRDTANILNRCNYLDLRDGDSVRRLAALGIDAAKLHLGADPALLMPPPPASRAAAILHARQIPDDETHLCVVINGNAPLTVQQNLISAIRIVCRRHAMVALLPIFDPPHDEKAVKRAARELGGYAIDLREPSDALALISVCRAVISLRLHALVFATAASVSALGIAADTRDRKIAAFAKSAGQEFLSADPPTVPTLVERIEELLKSSQSRAPILADSAAQMRRAAREELQKIITRVSAPSKFPKAQTISQFQFSASQKHKTKDKT